CQSTAPAAGLGALVVGLAYTCACELAKSSMSPTKSPDALTHGVSPVTLNEKFVGCVGTCSSGRAVTTVVRSGVLVVSSKSCAHVEVASHDVSSSSRYGPSGMPSTEKLESAPKLTGTRR